MTFFQHLKQISNYQLEGISSKIEFRRAQIFNYSLLLECFILLVNSIRHFYQGNSKSAVTVLLTLVFVAFLFQNKSVKRTTKYMLFLSLGLIVTYVFTHYIDPSKDIIQINLLILIATGLFLSGKQFYSFFFISIFLYYFTFFDLGYYKFYNPLGALTFIGLTVMMRLFVMDAEKNEEVIENQVKELEEKEEQKNRLFANITHEIRTPLTLILGANENLEKKIGTFSYNESISSNVHRMLELVNQILDLSKVQNKQRKIVLTNISITTLINDIIISFQSLAEVKNIEFETTIDTSLNLVEIDIDAYFKIIVNLLSNAFKFSEAGDKVTLEITKFDSRFLKLQVSDTGKGISEEELPHIFNQYFHSKIGVEASSGIGLALVKELVYLLQGEIKVKSTKGEGSCFYALLPITAEILDINAIEYQKNKEFDDSVDYILNLNFSNIEKKSTKDETNLTKKDKTLLLIEDNDDIRNYIKQVVENEYEIIEASDGEIGLELAFESIPDIIISDIMMPKVNGLQVLEKLKNDIKTSHIPIVLLTAKSSEKDMLTGLEYEADDYLTKPFNQAELLVRLRNRLLIRDKMQKRMEIFSIKNLKNDNIVSTEDKFLNAIKTFVKNHLIEVDFGPDELAKEIGLSKSQLLRKIRALTNFSTSIYMRNLRLEFAKEKLYNKEATIAEIAYETGFSSPNYFSKCFKEYTNLTPKEFLETIK